MDPILFRAAERIIAVVIAGVAIVLGYRLFLHMPVRREGEGNINLPGGVSIYLSRVGPGVFFALFGASILAFSLHSPITYLREGSSTPPPQQQSSAVVAQGRQYYRGITPANHATSISQPVWNSLELRLEMEFLSAVPKLLRADLSDAKSRNARARVERTKLALMHYAWEPEWGQFEDFKTWVESGAFDPVPQRLETAAEYFRQKSEELP